MKHFKDSSWNGLPSDATYDIIASDEERSCWLFYSTHKIPKAARNDCFFYSEGIKVNHFNGMTGVSFYRCPSDRDGLLRLVGHGLRESRPSQNHILSSLKRLLPSINKSAWKVSGGHVYLPEGEDLMMFQLCYGGANVNPPSN